MEHLQVATGLVSLLLSGPPSTSFTLGHCGLESRWNQLFLGRRRELSREGFSVWLAWLSWASGPWPIRPGPSGRLHTSVSRAEWTRFGRQWICSSTRDGYCVLQ